MLKKHPIEGAYALEEATSLVRQLTRTRFDASIDIAVRLGVDTQKGDQVVRGAVRLPHGTGRDVRVLALCADDKAEEAKKAGADLVGLDEYLKRIEDGWTEVDVIITTPDVMPRLGKLGRILGPRALMPNPRTGTVTNAIGTAVQEAKAGKINVKADKYGIVHAAIGRASFTAEHLTANALALLQGLQRLRPSAAKGTYMKSIHLSTTMGPSVAVDTHTIGV